jgi:hypothetical protein
MKFGEGGGQRVWLGPVNHAAQSSKMKSRNARKGFRTNVRELKKKCQDKYYNTAVVRSEDGST